MLVANGTLIATFVCTDSAGAPTAPTGTPTGVLFKNGTPTAVTVTVTMSTAAGIAAATIPSDAAQGDVFHITITGTVSGTSYTISSDPETVFAPAVPANVTQFGGANGTFSGGRPEVNATHWGGTAVASANVLIDGAITAAKIASNAMNGKGDWGTSLNLAALIETVGEAGSGLTDVATQVAATLAAVHGGGSWATATGFSTLTASGVREAVGLATNNLDTQLSAMATTAGIAALNGSQFTAIPWNAAWDAEIQRECTDAIVAAGLPRSGVTLRYTQVAANSGSKTADVLIGAVP